MSAAPLVIPAPLGEKPSGELQQARPRAGQGGGGRVPELDGLRGLAILLVVLNHYIFLRIRVVPGTTASYLLSPFQRVVGGMDLFLVLSGFLLGGILLDARDSSRYFRTFFVRRAVRIVPLYGLVLTLFALAVHSGALAGSLLVRSPAPWWSYLSFTLNLWMGWTGHFGGMHANALSPTWSLGLQEQFYLTLPLLVWLLPQRALAVLLAGLVPAAALARHYLLHTHNAEAAADMLPWCRMDAVALGALLALLRRSPAGWAWVCARPRLLKTAFGLGAAGLILVASGRLAGVQEQHRALRSAFHAGLLLLVLALPAGPLARLARARWLRWAGALGYGIYLLHKPVLILCLRALGRDPGRPYLSDAAGAAITACAVVLTLALAELSWRYLEQPCIRLGRRWRY
jgi:peptidoglycan/LPS O-acetylase OafA/YrhL